MRWAGHVARMGKKRNAYRILVENPEGKRPLGRPRWSWEDNNKMNLQEIQSIASTGFSAVVKAVMNLRFP